MADFTVRTFKLLLTTLKTQGFSFVSLNDFLSGSRGKTIFLRHDVDLSPINSLEFAEIETEFGIKGTYYFRTIPGSWDEEVIRKIAGMGHEIGYHYEDVSLTAERLSAHGAGHRAQGRGHRGKDSKKYVVCSKDYEEFEKQLVNITIESFSKNLEKLRKLVPIKTICMHGRPLSKWDSRLLWKYYDYQDYGISGEPYFDINFNEVLYLTDTGRRWDGDAVSVRDKALGVGRWASEENHYKDWKVKPINFRPDVDKISISPSPPLPLFPSSYMFHSTSDIIKAAGEKQLPDRIMMTFHPQRWTDKLGPWIKELIWQNVKNIGKYFLVKMRSNSSS